MKQTIIATLCAAALVTSACKGPAVTEESAQALMEKVLAAAPLASRQLQTWTEDGVVYSSTIHAESASVLALYPDLEAGIVPLRHAITGGRLAPVITTTFGDRPTAEFVMETMTSGKEPFEFVTHIGFAGMGGTKTKLSTARFDIAIDPYLVTIEPLTAALTESGLAKGRRIVAAQGGVQVLIQDVGVASVGKSSATATLGTDGSSRLRADIGRINSSFRGVETSAEAINFTGTSLPTDTDMSTGGFTLVAEGLTSSAEELRAIGEGPYTLSFESDSVNIPAVAIKRAAQAMQADDPNAISILTTALRGLSAEMRTSGVLRVATSDTHYEMGLDLALPPPTEPMETDADVLLWAMSTGAVTVRADMPSSVRGKIPGLDVDHFIARGFASEDGGRVTSRLKYSNDSFESQSGKAYDMQELMRATLGDR